MSLRKLLGKGVDRWKRFTRPRAGYEDRKEIPPVEDPPEEAETTGGEVAEEDVRVQGGTKSNPKGLLDFEPTRKRTNGEDSTPEGRRKARGAFGSPNGRKTLRRQRR